MPCFIQNELKEIYAVVAGNIPYIPQIDSTDLCEAVHVIKKPEDKHLVGDII